jgi:hypothetical protein
VSDDSIELKIASQWGYGYPEGQKLMSERDPFNARMDLLEALLREVYNHGESGDLHRRIGEAFGVRPGDDIPANPEATRG